MPAQATGSSAKQGLERENRLWLFACVPVGAIACIKGWGPPSEWALTFTQLSYRYGFLRRGLPGTLYGLAGLHSQAALVWVFNVQLLLLLVAIGSLCWQTRLQRQGSAMALAPLLSGSPVVTMLTLIRGYSDIPLAAVTVALLLVRSAGLRFILGMVVVPASVLSHEAYMLWLLPVLLLSFAVDALQGKTHRVRAVCYSLVLAIIAVALTLATSLHQNMTGRQVRAIKRDMATRTDIQLVAEPLYVLARSFNDNRKMVVAIHGNSDWRRRALQFTLELLPTFSILLYIFWRAVRLLLAGYSASVRRWIWAAVALAAMAPLSLHLLGWDAARFNSLATLTLFLMLLLVCRCLPECALSISTTERTVILFVIAFNLFTTVHSI